VNRGRGAVRFACYCGREYGELSRFVEHFVKEHGDKLPDWANPLPRRGGKWRLVRELKAAGLVRVHR